MKGNTWWILVADASSARLFSAEKIYGDWELIKKFDHPESREKDVDIISDKFGTFPNLGTSGSSAYTEPTDPKEAEEDRFAHQLAAELNLGRTKNYYHKLVLVAPPRFHGRLNKHCDSHVLNLIQKHLEKDFSHLKDHELIPRVQELIKE